MVAIKALSILAVAGSVIAAPAANAGSAVEARGAQGYGYGYHWSDSSSSDSSETPSKTEGDRKPHVVVENKNVVVTEYVTIPYGSRPPPQAPPAAPPAAPAPSKPEQPEQPTTPEVSEPAAPQWSDAPAPSPSAPASPPSGGSDTGYMAIVNEYRGKMGLPTLAVDSKLQSNAEDAAQSAQGTLTHKLNPGSMGQVMAPGEDADFKHVFVGGWICEIPSLLKAECTEQSKGWNYQGQTGHAEILTDPKYTKIGCGCRTGIWACDVA